MENPAKKYLEILQQITNGKHKFSELVLREGIEYQGSKLVEYPQLEVKQCYNNALLLALTYPELTYVEGWGHNIIPTEHAWCVTPDDVVVDPTWRDSEHSFYIGIPFKLGYVLEVIDYTGLGGVLIYQNKKIITENPSIYKYTK